MTKSRQRSPQKSRKPRRHTIKFEIPEDLPETLSWLRKFLGGIFSMNIEEISYLKNQFDQIYFEHISEFENNIGKIDSENPKQLQRYLDTKDILGHLLAVCKYLERIIDVKKLNQSSPSQKRSTGPLADSLQRELTNEIQTFSRRLEQSHRIQFS
jgi:hypothetical protein